MSHVRLYDIEVSRDGRKELTSYKKRRRELLDKPFLHEISFRMLLITAFVFAVLIMPVLHQKQDIVVYRSKDCSCVNDWVEHLKQQDYSVVVRRPFSLSAIREKYGIPAEFFSCHTSIAGNYFIEGHVSMETVNSLMRNKPNIAGIALPSKKNSEKAYVIESVKGEEVVAFDHNGQYKVFEKY